MFGPLSFPSNKDTSHDFFSDEETTERTACMICDEEFLLSRQEKDFLLHLLSSHNLVIRDVNKIACLTKYVEYWKMRLRCGKLEDFGFKTIRRIDLDGTSDSYGIPDISNHNLTGSSTDKIFVMSNDLSEDKILRENLQTQRLEFVLEQQKHEREMTDYCRECLFCHTEITGSTSDYLEHLSGKHNLFLGKPQNLVFVKQLIRTIENKLLNLRCLYCEKIFKDRNALKEHMRKKLHKRINPKNTEYDRFYIVNYLEMGKNWKNIDRVKENESPDSDGSDSDWSDWREDVQIQIVCLFCKNNSVTWDDTLQHMEIEHNFNYKESTVDMDFYQQVKLINYIRRQIHRLSCIVCDYISDNNEKLLEHLNDQNHFKLPDKSMWDQPEYFFPTYENDLFLCHLDDGACESETTSINDVQPAD